MATVGDSWARVNLANALTTLRLLLVPVLLWLAWEGQPVVFVYVLIGSLLTDLLDGPVARWLNQASDFGSRYDSVADAATYVALPLCAYWLKPDFVREEAIFFWTILIGYLVPIGFSLLRFGCLPSLHTVSSKCAAVFLGVAIPMIFLDWTRLPFQIGAIAYLVVAVEEMAILLLLPQRRANVPTLYHALVLRRESAAASEIEREEGYGETEPETESVSSVRS